MMMRRFSNMKKMTKKKIHDFTTKVNAKSARSETLPSEIFGSY